MNAIHTAMEDVEDAISNFLVTLYRDKTDMPMHESYRKSMGIFFAEVAVKLESWDKEEMKEYIGKIFGVAV